MSTKSWHLTRRTMLQGSGVAIGLPFLDCRAGDASPQARPKRFCAVYFPYGVVIQKDDAPGAKWNWFPNGEGSDYQFTEPHASLEPLHDDLTVFAGLSHPNGRRMDGHDSADTRLTAAELTGGQLKNSGSME